MYLSSIFIVFNPIRHTKHSMMNKEKTIFVKTKYQIKQKKRPVSNLYWCKQMSYIEDRLKQDFCL